MFEGVRALTAVFPRPRISGELRGQKCGARREAGQSSPFARDFYDEGDDAIAADAPSSAFAPPSLRLSSGVGSRRFASDPITSYQSPHVRLHEFP